MSYSSETPTFAMLRNGLSSRFERALSALESRTPHSWLMALDRAKVLPEARAVTTPSAAVRLFIKAGNGARVTDMDGASYIDLCMGDGTQILGHAHPVIQQAIVTQATRGWQFDLPADGQLELARLIQTAGATNERVALCGSGSAAMTHAIRVARAFTGKHTIAAFTGCPGGKSMGETPTILPYGHPAAFDQIKRRRHDLAAVIVEAVRGSDPNLERAPWLHGLLETCRTAGVPCILDERRNGFRLAYGGTQEVFGLMPDLVVYGKAAGGGLPLGAVAGRTGIMTSPDASQTKAVNPLSVTAGIAALTYLFSHRASLYPALNDAGRILAAQINAFTTAEKLPVEMRAAGSILRLHFAGASSTAEGASEAETAFNVLLLSRGVLTLPCQRGFLSTAHTVADLEQVRDAYIASLKDLRDDGVFAHGG
jgi:glutamate-1-semialdehyde aminotransferase